MQQKWAAPNYGVAKAPSSRTNLPVPSLFLAGKKYKRPILRILALSAATPKDLLNQLAWPQSTASPTGKNDRFRLAIVARTAGEIEAHLELARRALQAGGLPEHADIFCGAGAPEPCVWLFPGQGSQSLGMLMRLAEVWPAFRQQLQMLETQWSAAHGQSILGWIRAEDSPAARQQLNDTRQTQLALGLVEAALTATWRACGVDADAFAGHSYGELPALAAGGAMSTQTLFQLSRQRGRLLGEAGDQAPGGMLAAKCRREDLSPHLTSLAGQVFIANDNSPQQIVIAGSLAAIAEAGKILEAAGIASTPLRTACAFHSPLMAPVAGRWTEFLAAQSLNDIPPQRVYANASATSYPGSAESIRAGLTAQITASVRWREEMEALHADGYRNFIEVGPGRVLSDLTRRILDGRPHRLLTCDPGKADAASHLAHLFAQLYALGANPDLSSYSYSPPTMRAPIAFVPPAAGSALPAASTFFLANQQAVAAFFAQQQQIIGALAGQTDTALFQEIVRANQAVMQDFLTTQQLALPAGAIPATPAMPALPTHSAPIVPASPPEAGASDDVEAWIIGQLAEMTGLPPSRLHRHTQFESELGLDSITLVELWIQVSERFPQLDRRPDQLSGITCIADILRHIAGQAPAIPAPPVVAKSSVETWLFNELSMLTGLPVNRLNRQTQFEADLGIDSITMVELWIKLVEEFPAYGAHADGASRVRSVADVLAMVGADAPSVAAEQVAIAEHPASDWLSQLRHNIVARIAEERGISPASITGQSHFAKELGLDIFSRERIFEEEIGRHPKLAFAGRELLNVANLDELTRLLSRFNNLMSDKPLRIREDGRIVTSDDDAERVGRYVLVGQPPIPASELGSLPERILLIGEQGPNYDKIRQAFAGCDVSIETLYLSVKRWEHPSSASVVAIDDIDGISRILSQIAPDGHLPAVIYLGMPDLTLRAALDDPDAWRDEVERAGVGLFAFAKAASPIIRAMGREASVGVLTTQTSSAWAAASGVAKALAREWPKARIRTVRMLEDFDDLAPRMILKVLTWGPSAHDLQLVRDGVIRQVLIKKPINQDIVNTRRRHPRLNKNSVILLVGGATGITAEVSVMLARQYHAHIVAIGRTPMPETYPYQGISDDASLKRMLFDEVNRSDDEDIDAAALVRSEHARIRRQREGWTNRERVLEAGGRFSYYQCDIVDTAALAVTLSAIRSECGAVHGLIHGAGVIDDCLIEKKTVAEFKNVYYTKAISVFNLALGLHGDPLQFVYLFSSLASYTGTPGQTDYVAANEVINAAAKYWNARVAYPVRSLLWSVWTESGLVASSATQRQMARLGLAGISNEEGVRLLHDELIAGEKFDDWVLLTPQSTLDYTAGGSVHAPLRQEIKT